MAPPAPDRSPEPKPSAVAAERWRLFFQRSREPLFYLNRHRRVLFVNRAWEQLTGVPAQQARALACRRQKPVTADKPWHEVLEHLLCPPPEVLEGRAGRSRRLIPGAERGRRWWDIEFFPLLDEQGLFGVLGKVTVVAADTPAEATVLPEKLAALRQQAAGRYGLDALASGVPAMQRVVEQVRLASRLRTAVLLVGEPGSGKEWVARTIHQLGLAREQAFVALDCGGLPEEALAAVLFRPGGPARESRMGTVYLRDVARLPRELQGRLEDWLPERETGARLIAACSMDPAAEVRAGRLLEEVRCALGTLTIELPPLRERLADLPALVERMLARANDDGGRRVVGLTPAAWEHVRGHRWPDNLRELYAVLAGARERAAGERIDAGDLPAYLRLQHTAVAPERPLPLDKLLEETERRLIALALRRARGNQSRAAELLGLWRQRLARRMKQLGIEEK